MPRPHMPVPNNPKWAPREYSRLRSVKDKGSPGTTWKPMQDYASQINALTEFCKTLWKQMSNIKASQAATLEMFPFRIYTPPAWAYNPPATGSISWRNFKVRSGCVINQYVTTQSVFGTDGYRWPDQQVYSLPVENNLYTVPISSSTYWFWIEKVIPPIPNTGSYILRYGADPTVASIGNPTPWDTFPTASSKYVPIGFVDTLTQGITQQALVRQFQRTDVVSAGGGGNYVQMAVCTNGETQLWMVDAYPSGSTPPTGSG